MFSQFALIMGCLVFGVYLSITFLITSSNVNGYSRDTTMFIIYPIGYFLYSLVPVTRLIYTTTVVDR